MFYAAPASYTVSQSGFFENIKSNETVEDRAFRVIYSVLPPAVETLLPIEPDRLKWFLIAAASGVLCGCGVFATNNIQPLVLDCLLGMIFMLAKFSPFMPQWKFFSQCQFSSRPRQPLKRRASDPLPMSSLHLEAIEAGTAGSIHVHNQPQPKDMDESPPKNGPVLRIRRPPPGPNAFVGLCYYILIHIIAHYRPSNNKQDRRVAGPLQDQTGRPNPSAARPVARRRPRMKGRTVLVTLSSPRLRIRVRPLLSMLGSSLLGATLHRTTAAVDAASRTRWSERQAAERRRAGQPSHNRFHPVGLSAVNLGSVP